MADRTRPPHPLGAISHDAPVLVIGLGRFGAATAGQLERQDREVLVVDTDAGLVQKWSDRVTHAVQADATDIDALRQIGAQDFAIAVVGTGSDLESSVLITANLVDLGIPQIWAKAISRSHGTILSRIGANHVVYPEREAGERTAHLVSGRMLDFIEFDDDFAVVKMFPPRAVRGQGPRHHRDPHPLRPDRARHQAARRARSCRRRRRASSARTTSSSSRVPRPTWSASPRWSRPRDGREARGGVAPGLPSVLAGPRRSSVSTAPRHARSRRRDARRSVSARSASCSTATARSVVPFGLVTARRRSAARGRTARAARPRRARCPAPSSPPGRG